MHSPKKFKGNCILNASFAKCNLDLNTNLCILNTYSVKSQPLPMDIQYVVCVQYTDQQVGVQSIKVSVSSDGPRLHLST